MSDPVARCARWYAYKLGWFVVPLHAPIHDDNNHCIGCSCESWRRRKQPDYRCTTPGKHPILTDWEMNASNDLDLIRGWWERWPWANVGIAAGPSGLIVFDADSYKDNYAGDKLLTQADEETITSITGGAGVHLVYRMPEDAYYTNARGRLPRGIDIRGWGGQFVAPPSLHPSGSRYQWETGYGPHELEPLPIPQHLRDILDGWTAMAARDVKFSEGVSGKPDLSQWQISQRILGLIHEPADQGKRSETDQSVITALVLCGADNDQIRAVFEHYPIGSKGKYRDKGNHALHYLALSVKHARAWCEQKQKEEVEQRASAFLAMAAR